MTLTKKLAMTAAMLALLVQGAGGQVEPDVAVVAPTEDLAARAAVPPPHLVTAAGELTITGLRPEDVASPLSGNPLPDFAADTDIRERKEHFFGYLLPLVQAENKRIHQIRTRLAYIREHFRWGRAINEWDQQWLALVAEEYRLSAFDPEAAASWTRLQRRVDTLPPELVLVQAANESAWGTSRFAREGNNLFGQWCFGQGCGMVPLGRPFGATYEVARYGTVRESVGSYMHNLNTGRAYRKFRDIRARERDQGQEAAAADLATGLRNYSERGIDYVNELRAMIRHNADIIDQLNQRSARDGKS